MRRLLLEDHVWCTRRGQGAAQHARLYSTGPAHHGHEFQQLLLDLMRLARSGMKCETRYIHGFTPFRVTLLLCFGWWLMDLGSLGGLCACPLVRVGGRESVRARGLSPFRGGCGTWHIPSV